MIGKVIRVQRKIAGLNQEALAKQAGVSISTISKIESGATPVKISFLFAICNILEISPTVLVYYLESQMPNTLLSRDAENVLSREFIRQTGKI